MTDAPHAPIDERSVHTTDEARKRLRRRYAAERRYRLFGLAGVLSAVAFLVLLLSTIVGQAIPAFTHHYIEVPLDLTSEHVDRRNPAQSNFSAIIREGVAGLVPFAESRAEQRVARGVLSDMADVLLREALAERPRLIGTTTRIALPVSDIADLYLKGLIVDRQPLAVTGPTAPSGTRGEITLRAETAGLGQPGTIFDPQTPSYLAFLNGGVVKLTGIDPGGFAGEVLVPLDSASPAAADAWRLVRIVPPEAQRQVSDREIAYVDYLHGEGMIERRFNSIFFTRGASREPEMAGIWGAVVGSFLTLVVTLLMSFPLGAAAAIYLEEFAPRNRWTDLIEVNINNLAAVPSIVFGLLGLAVFLNFAELPRSAPLVGGMVLALMTLPTIIIASRAALKAVPPSIREGALAVGASKIQTIFHHVLPLAMPGIMTGTIIGMAQALGETAPLLMIGMVAFIVDIPGGFTEPATALPVQIFMWAEFPEAAFRHRTAAAILVLLAFLIAMNALAVILRRRFERRW